MAENSLAIGEATALIQAAEHDFDEAAGALGKTER